MANKSSSAIYSMVEKAYFRLQAGDVLTHCMEDGSTEPIHEMIQEMVVAGPQSLEALREILGEARKRKSQVNDDVNQVTNQLATILKGYGINIKTSGGKQVLLSMTEAQLLELMDAQKIVETDKRTDALQVMKNSRELTNTLLSKIELLENIENYLQDWLWGLTYQFIKHDANEDDQDSVNKELQ